MRWIAATTMLVTLALALTGPVLAQELRVLENVDAREQVGSTPPPAITQVVPAPSSSQTTKLDDRGVR